MIAYNNPVVNIKTLYIDTDCCVASYKILGYKRLTNMKHASLILIHACLYGSILKHKDLNKDLNKKQFMLSIYMQIHSKKMSLKHKKY